MKGIEPSYAAWEAAVLPLNYTREKGGGPDLLPANHVVGLDSRGGLIIAGGDCAANDAILADGPRGAAHIHSGGIREAVAGRRREILIGNRHIVVVVGVDGDCVLRSPRIVETTQDARAAGLAARKPASRHGARRDSVPALEEHDLPGIAIGSAGSFGPGLGSVWIVPQDVEEQVVVVWRSGVGG